MDCDRLEESDTAENYVVGQLGEVERAEFELHFLNCRRCFEQVQLLQDLQVALAPRRRSRGPWLAMLAVAASLLITAGVAWLPLRSLPKQDPVRQAKTAGIPAKPAENPVLLAELSPPRYSMPHWRAAGQTGFELAMQRYSKGDYAGATPLLIGATLDDPRNSAAEFFLGICYLMQGRESEAIARLSATISLRDSPELEEAHLYMAEALWRRKEIPSAVSELRRAIALGGPRKAEEQRLLRNLMEAHPAP